MEKQSVKLNENKKPSQKQKYTRPAVKRYSTPKLRKHKSYKDITLVIVAITPPVVS